MEYSRLTVHSPEIRGIDEAHRGVGKLAAGLGLFVLVLCWLLVFNALRVDWSTNPQYSYGWFVPLLALGLFWFRWTTRPQPAASPHSGFALAIAWAALALLLPIRLIEEANPEWRLIQWAHMTQMVVQTF